jgi:hypothetical protein
MLPPLFWEHEAQCGARHAYVPRLVQTRSHVGVLCRFENVERLVVYFPIRGPLDILGRLCYNLPAKFTSTEIKSKL